MNIPITYAEVKANQNLIPQYPNRRMRRAYKQAKSGGNRAITRGRKTNNSVA